MELPTGRAELESWTSSYVPFSCSPVEILNPGDISTKSLLSVFVQKKKPPLTA